MTAPASTQNAIDRALQSREVIITCGTGGVGKTTLSAALAVRAACLGMKAVVITIDPAKRLATSLGLKELGDEPTDLTPLLKRVVPDLKGTLHAIIPDTRITFEHFMCELAPNPTAAQRIMDNPIFQIFAKEFSGANEYMALERLHAIRKSAQFDCIILDTPPSRNTLDFLQAPETLSRFFEEKLIRWLVVPANRIVAAGVRKALGLLEKLTGAKFMKALFDFASDLFLVQDKFKDNLRQITEFLKSPRVGFLMVTTPTPEALPEAKHFIDAIADHDFHFDGVALNRTLGYLGPPAADTGQSPAFAAAYALIRGHQENERQVLLDLARGKIPLSARLPELARDVHSVEDLYHVAMRF